MSTPSPVAPLNDPLARRHIPVIRELPVRELTRDECRRLKVHSHPDGCSKERRQAYLYKSTETPLAFFSAEKCAEIERWIAQEGLASPVAPVAPVAPASMALPLRIEPNMGAGYGNLVQALLVDANGELVARFPAISNVRGDINTRAKAIADAAAYLCAAANAYPQLVSALKAMLAEIDSGARMRGPAVEQARAALALALKPSA